MKLKIVQGQAEVELRLSPCGESGLKSAPCRRWKKSPTSLPVWGEWIEILMQTVNGLSALSLPVWGEWIEITDAVNEMKAVDASLPVWGEWIEMGTWVDLDGNVRSLPVWGEWIEISSELMDSRDCLSLPVWGEWIEI